MLGCDFGSESLQFRSSAMGSSILRFGGHNRSLCLLNGITICHCCKQRSLCLWNGGGRIIELIIRSNNRRCSLILLSLCTLFSRLGLIGGGSLGCNSKRNRIAVRLR